MSTTVYYANFKVAKRKTLFNIVTVWPQLLSVVGSFEIYGAHACMSFVWITWTEFSVEFQVTGKLRKRNIKPNFVYSFLKFRDKRLKIKHISNNLWHVKIWFEKKKNVFDVRILHEFKKKQTNKQTNKHGTNFYLKWKMIIKWN